MFNFYKVYAILDEVFLAGEIEETSKHVVLARLDQRKLLACRSCTSFCWMVPLTLRFCLLAVDVISGEARLNSAKRLQDIDSSLYLYCTALWFCFATSSNIATFRATLALPVLQLETRRSNSRLTRPPCHLCQHVSFALHHLPLAAFAQLVQRH